MRAWELPSRPVTWTGSAPGRADGNGLGPVDGPIREGGVIYVPMGRGSGLPKFGSFCVFCGIEVFSMRRDGEESDPCAPILFFCPECGAYRICEEFDAFLWERPVRRSGVLKFVTEAALEGFLPRLCVDQQDFEEVSSPLLRAWQKCRECRDAPPRPAAGERLVHRREAETACLAEEEWREFEVTAGRGKG